MGSGHFLVAALPMLARMRMHEEGLSAEEAVDRVIAENLHGLEIDERCTQIAAFALAMAAWTFDGNSGHRELPEMNLACSGLAPEGDLEDWETLAGDDERLQNGMRRLYSIFQDAPTLGSLIDPSAAENRLDTATFEDLEPLLEEALMNGQNAEKTERGVVAYGVAQAAGMMSSKYDLVSTNVPYLSYAKQEDTVKEHSEEKYPNGKYDLSTVFLKRCLNYTKDKGACAPVSPQNWLFLTRYADYRKSILNRHSWRTAVWLGAQAFDTISGEVVKVNLSIFENREPSERNRMFGLDASEMEGTDEKRNAVESARLRFVQQFEQLQNPDARILLDDAGGGELLQEYAISMRGIVSGDKPKLVRHFWEIPTSGSRWRNLQSTVEENKHFGGREQIIDWKHEGKDMLRHGADNQAYGEKGVVISLMGNLDATLYTGELYDNNAGAVVPIDEAHLKALWAYCSSDDYEEEVRRIDRKMNVTNATLLKVPFDLEYWQKVAEEKYPDGLPDPYSDDPTQWIFHGHPKPSDRPLQVAVARLLGYRWPAERDEDMDLSDEAREWIERCKALDHHVDDDGIVCIPPVQGERAAADRIRDLLADAYGDDWGEGVLQDLLDEWGYRSGGLEGWLDGATARQKGKFAQQHNKLFGHRPFIWHVTDEHEDGFSALVNYHQLDRANLERLTYTYLGDWINQQESAMERGDEGAEGRLLAAQDLQDELKNIIEGEPPYDIFVRWKEAHEQPIGWAPDLNDGVLLNIKPFIEAGILRDEPNARYTKDRGKNPEGAPWGPKRYNRYEDVPDEHKLKDEDGEVIEYLTNEVKRRVGEEMSS
jgi:hypothetical protein